MHHIHRFPPTNHQTHYYYTVDKIPAWILPKSPYPSFRHQKTDSLHLAVDFMALHPKSIQSMQTHSSFASNESSKALLVPGGQDSDLHFRQA
jgi:hypothetical protein